MILAYDGRPASRLDERHWQGGFPLDFRDVATAGVDLVVLAAEECHPDAEGLQAIRKSAPGLSLVCAPLHDDGSFGYLPEATRLARRAARRVTAALRDGRRVLVTCAAGRNRSGLVSALAMVDRRRISGREAVRRVRAARPDALTNDTFRRWLESLPAPGREVHRWP